MSIDLWLYDIATPHPDFSDNTTMMTMRDFSPLMLRKILAGMLKKERSELVFSQGTGGKPSLKNNNEINFNVSHTGTLWGMAVTRSKQQIGLDIETNRDRQNMQKMMQTYFHAQEFTHYKNLPDKQARIDYFYTLWTQKEAYAKYLGQGLKYNFAADIFLKETIEKLNIISGQVLSTQTTKGSKIYLSIASGSKISPRKITVLGDKSLNVQIMD